MPLQSRVEEEVRECLRLKAKGLTRREIALRLGLTERQVKRRLASNGLKARAEMGSNQLDGLFDTDSLPDDELYTRIDAEEKRQEIVELTSTGEDTDYLVINDLHVPFHDTNTLNQAVEYAVEHGIGNLIINGDLLDLFGVSRFAKDKHITLKTEMNAATKLLSSLSDIFELIILIEGNHERRIKNWTYANISPDISWLFKVDLLDQLSDKFSNVFYAGGWWAQIGTVIFAHPNSFSSIPGRTAINVSDHFMGRGIYHSGVVIGHTHKIFNSIHRRTIIMETGCAVNDMDYTTESGNVTRDPWERGFAVVHIKANGDMDYNKSRVFRSE